MLRIIIVLLIIIKYYRQLQKSNTNIILIIFIWAAIEFFIYQITLYRCPGSSGDRASVS